MELSRRDALVALGAGGAAVGATAIGLDTFGPEAGDPTAGDSGPLSDHHRRTVVAVAHEVYPGAVSDIDQFVETFLDGRTRQRPAHVAGIATAVDALDEYCRRWWSRSFLDLDSEGRDRALTEMGLEIAEPNPEGSDVERVRYYVVDELLFALYASPTGGELLGIENPPGHPGGTESYRRGPASE